MNRLPTSRNEDFDRSLRQLQQHAEGAVSPATLARLRQALREAMIEWLRENMPDALCDQV